MELNSRTKLVGGVLALAVAALIYDRVIAGGGATPAAAATPSGDTVAPATVPTDTSQPKLATPDTPAHQGVLSGKLAALDFIAKGPLPREDAFMAPVAWFPVDDSAEPAVKAQPRRTGGHSVSSVIMDKRETLRSAVVDGRTLRPGAPTKVSSEGKSRTYELVRAWVDTDKKTHVEVLIDDELYELTAEEPRLKDQ